MFPWAYPSSPRLGCQEDIDDVGRPRFGDVVRGHHRDPGRHVQDIRRPTVRDNDDFLRPVRGGILRRGPRPGRRRGERGRGRLGRGLRGHRGGEEDPSSGDHPEWRSAGGPDKGAVHSSEEPFPRGACAEREAPGNRSATGQTAREKPRGMDRTWRRDGTGGRVGRVGDFELHGRPQRIKKGAASTTGSCTQFASFPGRRAALLRGSVYVAQAGLLAHGSLTRAFPSAGARLRAPEGQWPRANNSSYSGGTAPDFHGVPY
jgi:hypothetical protein